MADVTSELFEAARAARENAYARYSGFKVGAAILADDGKVYAGANVENASFPEGQCAETSAIGAMITGGGRQIKEILVLGPRPCAPCGGCRQRIVEFSTEATIVHIADADGGSRQFKADELLPASFSLDRHP